MPPTPSYKQTQRDRAKSSLGASQATFFVNPHNSYQMAEEHHHKHHLFHHKEEENTGPVDYEKQEKHARHKEHLGELGAVTAGAFALYEKHKAKKDPENAHKHKVEEEILAAAAVGAGGYAFHEKHERKEYKKEAKEGEGGKKHHFG